MLKDCFEFEVERWMWETIVYWIPKLARADCHQCLCDIHFNQNHQFSGVAGVDFERFHLITFFQEAVLVAWDLLDNKDILDNMQTNVFIALQYRGFDIDDIIELNTRENLKDYGTADCCLNRVFTDLWLRNYEPLFYDSVLGMLPFAQTHDQSVDSTVQDMPPAADKFDDQSAESTVQGMATIRCPESTL